MNRQNHGPPSAMLPVVLLLLTFTCVPSRTAFAQVLDSDAQSVNVTLTYLRRTLQALQGAMDFFQRQYANINLDAVIGTRIVEGTLKVLLANLEQNQQIDLLPNDIVSNIRALYYLAKRVSDNAEPNVAVTEPKYYQRIGPATHEGMWELDYPRRTLSSSVPMWSYLPLETMTETESDDCLTELFGTSGKTEKACVISDHCWDQMTRLGYSQYSLSHEIFYFQLGEMSGCLPHIAWKIWRNNQPNLRELQDTFCANMLRETMSIARAGYPAPRQDLFMENAALCGMYGYWEFFRYHWLEMILSWQDRQQGCFRWTGWPQQRMGAQYHHITKREERRLDNGCLCHRTTVAASALVQYVRYLAEAFLATEDLDQIELD